MLKLIEREIDKNKLMDVIEYELNYRDQAHQAKINAKNEEINAKDQEINAIEKENVRLKAKLKKHGIEF